MTETPVLAPSTKNFKTLSGLGDAVFAVPIAAHFAKLGPVRVSTNYPEVFQFVKGVTATTDKVTPEDHVPLRYQPHPGHNYYGDYCRSAGVEMLPFFMPWINGVPLSEMFHTKGRAVCLVKEPSTPHMYRDRNDFSITPEPAVMQKWMLENRDRFFYISVEHKTNTIKSRLDGIDSRISINQTTADYIHLVNRADHIATQIGHLAPLAQAMGKPLTLFQPERKNRSGFLKHVSAEMILVPELFTSGSVEIV